ncbi:variable surface protein [Plasmodium gonderi]|uniref:Variable surface protein n=1 Tax=Plasmodium gonderi TaxID=77519 RepID=A0A1Y1JPI1_PLAGO|nr:variable surface protein [Plasmodium gonderi]GAW84526.1 variable surface protein [Plasmodium gonderi]
MNVTETFKIDPKLYNIINYKIYLIHFIRLSITLKTNSSNDIIFEALKSKHVILTQLDTPMLMSYCISSLNVNSIYTILPNELFTQCFMKDRSIINASSCHIQKDKITSLLNEWIYEIKHPSPTKMILPVCIILKIIVLLIFFIIYNFSKINKFINNTYYRRNIMRNFLHWIYHFRTRQDSQSCSGKKRTDIIYI